MHAGNGTLGHTTLLHPSTTPGFMTLLHPVATPSPRTAPNFQKPTWDSLLAMAEMHFASVVAKIAEFGAGTEVCAFTEDGIADVIEVGL